MSRQDRLREYSNPRHGPQGAGRDQANIDRWSNRASENSKTAPRAKSGEMSLPSTKVNQRDTSMRPYAPRTNAGVDATEANHEGSSYMKSVRRQT